MSQPLENNGELVRRIIRLNKDGGHGLLMFPTFLKDAIKKRVWEQGWIDPTTKEVYTQPDFRSFVETPVLEGLGSSIEQVKALCQHDGEAIILINEMTTKKPGGPNNPEGNNQHVQKEVNHNNIMNDQTKAIQGTSLDYTLRRLKKEAPGLLEKVVNREMSPNAAAVEAGFRITPIQLNPTDPYKAAKTILKAVNDGKINRDYVDTLINILKG